MTVAAPRYDVLDRGTIPLVGFLFALGVYPRAVVDWCFGDGFGDLALFPRYLDAV